MERLRILRIVLMIACIFVGGIAIGRYLAPPPDFNIKVFGKEGREISPRTIVAYYDSKLQLSPDQKRSFGRLSADFVQEIAKTEQRSKERFDLFRGFYPKLRQLLRADQHAAFDKLTEEHTQRMDKMLK